MRCWQGVDRKDEAGMAQRGKKVKVRVERLIGEVKKGRGLGG